MNLNVYVSNRIQKPQLSILWYDYRASRIIWHIIRGALYTHMAFMLRHSTRQPRDSCVAISSGRARATQPILRLFCRICIVYLDLKYYSFKGFSPFIPDSQAELCELFLFVCGEEMNAKHERPPPPSKSAMQSRGKLAKFAYHEYSIGNRVTGI